MSQRVRMFAVAGVVAVLALGGGLLFLSRGQSATPAAVKQIKPSVRVVAGEVEHCRVV